MGKEIKFKTIGTYGGFKKEETTCRGCVIHNRVLEMDDIAEDFARYAKLDSHDARYYANFFVDYMVHAVENGCRLNLGAFSLYLTMKGRICGANGQFVKGRNKMELNISVKKPMADALASLEPVNVTMNGETLRVTRVMDVAAKTDGVVTLGEKVLVAGHTLRVDVSRDDEGVWLETADGKKVLSAEVLASTGTTLDCIFRGTVESGEYRFVVCTRMGDPSLPSPAVASRKVSVGNAARKVRSAGRKS